jgi:hypothetical protein
VSARENLASGMIYRKENVPMGVGDISEFVIPRTTRAELMKYI